MLQPSEIAVPEKPAGVAGDRAFLSITALLFLASAAVTIYWCRSMTGGMPMPGGWTMSMAWMRMAGQSASGAAAAFLGMWAVMMVAMMSPSLVPMLLKYRRSLRCASNQRLAGPTALAGAGYFLVWIGFGAAVYLLGSAVTAAEMRWSTLARWVPLGTSIIFVLAGLFQFTAWKARHLRSCQNASPGERPLSSNARDSWQHGVSLGLHCALCCCGFMAILLVIGAMDLGAMAVVALAITLERLAPWPRQAVRVAGIVTIAAGAFLLVRALATT